MTTDDIRELAEAIWKRDTANENVRLLTYAVLYGWAARLDREASRDPPTGPQAHRPHTPSEGTQTWEKQPRR